jgi:hypothetical protein
MTITSYQYFYLNFAHIKAKLTFLFAQTSFDLKMLTPLFSGGTSEVQTSEHHKTWREVRASKLCQRCPVRLQHGVRTLS